jgi:hypothetical protein
MHTKLFMSAAIPQRLCAIKFEFAVNDGFGSRAEELKVSISRPLYPCAV